MKKLNIQKSVFSFCVLSFIFVYSYIYPRFLVSVLGEQSLWISYLYTYGMGLVFFFLSVFWIFTRSGVNPLRRKLEKSWLAAIFLGCFFMFCLHGLWIFIAVSFPMKGWAMILSAFIERISLFYQEGERYAFWSWAFRHHPDYYYQSYLFLFYNGNLFWSLFF